ncbi:hypothetical protein POM88_048106 [Heracleum sosnowskyi]|uniref:Uncharacterized protein n=1 Tax=Heracleum sosnowskyi TaxID=360622 RepID=A0AAD8GVM2_9APIA|nr:hypothetical protein POM88_048106 [Heracleum sosnowskyi]
MMQVLIKRFVVSIHGSGVHKGLLYVAFTLRDDSRTPIFSKPAFTSEELYGKVFDLQDKVEMKICICRVHTTRKSSGMIIGIAEIVFLILKHVLNTAIQLEASNDKIVGRILNSMQALHGHAFIEDHPEHLVMALTEAFALVGPIKCYPSS